MDLTYNHILHMLLHMRTTLVINNSFMAKIKSMAAARGITLSKMVETLLRLGLQRETQQQSALRKLPSFDAGKAFVDVADRDALYRAMKDDA